MIRRLLLALSLVATNAVASDAPFLWRVQGPKAVHYLMGSVHLLPGDAYPLPPALDAAYEGTTALMLEADPGALETPEVQARMLGRGAATNGLQAEIPAPLYERVRKQAEEMQLSPGLCDGFKPWFCALTLGVLQYEQDGMEAANGLDLHFYKRAMAENRPIHWFETPDEQIDLFGGMSAPMSAQFLASTLDDLDEPANAGTELVRQWRSNDVAAIEATVLDMRTRFPEAYQRLVEARNRDWMTELVATFDGETPTLVITGAAHLVGPAGLVALLREKGYAVTPVQNVEPVVAPP